MSASLQDVPALSELWKRVGLRWLVFSLLFVASVLAPFAFRFDLVPSPLFGWWMLWPFLALPSEGFTDSRTIGGAVYIGETSMYLAVAFWAVIGVGFAWMTRQFRLRYVLLSAYPTMLLVLVVVTSVLSALGYFAVSSL